MKMIVVAAAAVARGNCSFEPFLFMIVLPIYDCTIAGGGVVVSRNVSRLSHFPRNINNVSIPGIPGNRFYFINSRNSH
jgi:hypothetical protein